jgi:hypothetical protein
MEKLEMEMKKDNISPTYVSWGHLVSGYALGNHIREMLAALQQSESLGVHLTSRVFLILKKKKNSFLYFSESSSAHCGCAHCFW